MGIKEAILATKPTSYWPLDDTSGNACHDDLHEASLSQSEIKPAVVPSSQSSAPYFDGEIGSYLTITDDKRYSQSYANALSVAAWICPLTLDNTHTSSARGKDQYVHYMEKAGGSSGGTVCATILGLLSGRKMNHIQDALPVLVANPADTGDPCDPPHFLQQS
jgi:hypothetical protein